MSDKKLKHQCAFTLIELVMVISILGITAAIALPRFSHANANYRLKAAANRVIQDFNLAIKQSQSISQNVTILFNKNNHSYQITNLPSLNDPTKTYQVELKHHPYQVKIRAVIMTAGGNSLLINPMEQLRKSGTITLQYGNKTRSISFDADTNLATDTSTW